MGLDFWFNYLMATATRMFDIVFVQKDEEMNYALTFVCGRHRLPESH